MSIKNLQAPAHGEGDEKAIGAACRTQQVAQRIGRQKGLQQGLQLHIIPRHACGMHDQRHVPGLLPALQEHSHPLQAARLRSGPEQGARRCCCSRRCARCSGMAAAGLQACHSTPERPLKPKAKCQAKTMLQMTGECHLMLQLWHVPPRQAGAACTAAQLDPADSQAVS